MMINNVGEYRKG